MINLRYHIVSITAVFLALGIGLTLGTSFLDKVTVETLKAQLEDVEAQVRETNATNDDLSGRVDALEGRDEELGAELPERLLSGRLEAVPVLLVATEGTDEDLVGAAVAALASAGADVAGTWWLTDRWLLDDPKEVGDLSELLDLTTSDVDRLRRNSAIQVADLLEAAAQPASAAEPQAPVEGAEVPSQPAPPAPSEPELIAALHDAGFIDYAALPGSGDEAVLLPGVDARYVVVSDGLAEHGGALFVNALLDEIVAEGPAPVVAAQGLVDLPAEENGDPASEDARRTTFVGPLREGELTADRLSTVDSLDLAAGTAATVLAVEDLSTGHLGHFGVASGAVRLLPGADPDT